MLNAFLNTRRFALYCHRLKSITATAPSTRRFCSNQTSNGVAIGEGFVRLLGAVRPIVRTYLSKNRHTISNSGKLRSYREGCALLIEARQGFSHFYLSNSIMQTTENTSPCVCGRESSPQETDPVKILASATDDLNRIIYYLNVLQDSLSAGSSCPIQPKNQAYVLMDTTKWVEDVEERIMTACHILSGKGATA